MSTTQPQNLIIKGLVSPLDCFVRVNVPFSWDNDPISSEAPSTLVHELAHYVQLISTPVGVAIRLLQQWYAANLISYVQNLPQPITPLDVSDKYYLLPADRDGLYHFEQVFTLKSALQVFYAPFVTSDSRSFCARCLPPNLQHDTSSLYAHLRRHTPIDIDHHDNSFTLRNTDIKIRVAANCILEYMARYLELGHNWKLSERDMFLSEILRPEHFEYHLPWIYLAQKGALDDELWRYYVSILPMILMQLSLMMNPHCLSPRIIQKYSINVEQFRPETLFLRVLSDPGPVEPLAYLNRTRDKSFDSNRLANTILSHLRWPSVSELLGCFRNYIAEIIERATDKDRAKRTYAGLAGIGVKWKGFAKSWTRLPQARRRRTQFEKMYECSETIWSNDRILQNPASLVSKHGAPQPIVMVPSEAGLMCTNTDSDFWDYASEYGYRFISHIGQKLLHSEDLGCYLDAAGETAIVGCPYLKNCVAEQEKKGLAFCDNVQWKNEVMKFLAGNGIRIDGVN